MVWEPGSDASLKLVEDILHLHEVSGGKQEKPSNSPPCTPVCKRRRSSAMRMSASGLGSDIGLSNCQQGGNARRRLFVCWFVCSLICLSAYLFVPLFICPVVSVHLSARSSSIPLCHVPLRHPRPLYCPGCGPRRQNLLGFAIESLLSSRFKQLLVNRSRRGFNRRQPVSLLSSLTTQVQNFPVSLLYVFSFYPAHHC